MTLNPQKTIINGNEYEIVPAEVIDFDYQGLNKQRLYAIKCKLIGALGSSSPADIINAKALDANIKNIPISGEIVFLLKGPTSFNTPGRSGQEYYYTNPISIQSSVHHNGLPGVTEFIRKKNPQNEEARNNAKDGILIKSSENLQSDINIDPTFPERLDVYPIQPYSGDIIIEGRWGQSIRFGSTVDERRNYPLFPYWKEGTGATGNPILIISNGTNPPRDKGYNQFILENIDTDDSSIWLTSGQSVPFTPSSRFKASIEDKGVDLYIKNGYAGNQAIISSDRIILNAKKQEIIGFSKEGIGFSSEKIFSIDSRYLVEMESKKINLGLNANEPALLGDTTGEWLLELCNLFKDTLSQITSLTVPTGVGPSGTPINSANFQTIRNSVTSLSNRIDDLKSQLVFLNKKSST